MRVYVLAKPLDVAKLRLASCLNAERRRALAAAMLEDVLVQVRAARTVDEVSVVTSDPAVALIAARHSANPLFEGAGRGMNAAAGLALSHARANGGEGVIVLPADLPWLTVQGIDALSAGWRRGEVRGCRAHDGGTNALLVDAALDWRFVYGPDSFAAHAETARRLGLRLQPVEDAGLTFDVDRPDDLVRLIDGPSLGRATARVAATMTDFGDDRRWA